MRVSEVDRNPFGDIRTDDAFECLRSGFVGHEGGRVRREPWPSTSTSAELLASSATILAARGFTIVPSPISVTHSSGVMATEGVREGVGCSGAGTWPLVDHVAPIHLAISK